MLSVSLEQETRHSGSGMTRSAECEVQSLKYLSATYEHDVIVTVLSHI